ncbi:hypothetical protein NQZ68_024551 [Dissostichus eleginoides]|nr:hypothetical protein NQZ68_024551 [Dissostichus eleginoides]
MAERYDRNIPEKRCPTRYVFNQGDAIQHSYLLNRETLSNTISRALRQLNHPSRDAIQHSYLFSPEMMDADRCICMNRKLITQRENMPSVQRQEEKETE